MRQSILTVLFGFILVIIYSIVSHFGIPQNVVHAQTSPFPVVLYQANPQTYNWKVNGTSYSSKNPYGFEIYQCTNPPYVVSDNTMNLCIPNAQTINGSKIWPNYLFNGLGDSCSSRQPGTDGPLYTADTRTMNGTGKPDSQVQVCSALGNNVRAPFNFLNVTKSITYNSSYCSNGDKIVISSREDPSNAACLTLNPEDVLSNPQNYSQNQRNCLMYVDNEAQVTACMNGVCHSDVLDTPSLGTDNHPDPAATYTNICNLFTQGNGTYSVNLVAYDGGGVAYGSSSFWLTNLHFGLPTPTPTPAPTFTISGNIFNDINRNGKIDAGEGNIAQTPTITASRGTVNVAANGSYTINNVTAGIVTVSYSSLPNGYYMTSPLNGPPSSFSVTVGGTCTVNGASGAVCTTGSITNLNFGVSNTHPWWQSTCSDVREDGIVNLLPAGSVALISNAVCSNTPGLAFTGDTNANFGQGQASLTNQIVGGVAYPEFTSNAILPTAYSSLLTKAQNANITPTNLSTVCTLTNCSLPPNLAHGIYLATGNVNLNAFTFPANQNYVILINGTLTIQGTIAIPVGSTAFFSTTGNISVIPTVGSAATVTTSSLDGWYVAGQSFIVNSQNNCADLRLNIGGSVVVNSLGRGGAFQNNRDLCGNDAADPTVSFTQRLDFILHAPQFLKNQQTLSREAP